MAGGRAERTNDLFIDDDGLGAPSEDGQVRHDANDLKGQFDGRVFSLLRPASREVTATAIATTSSTTPSTVPGMTITPPAGTYVAIFGTWGGHAANNAELNVGLAVDGVDILSAERRWGGTGQSDNMSATLVSHKRITVDGTEEIQGRFRRRLGSGLVAVYDRVLLLIEVADG